MTTPFSPTELRNMVEKKGEQLWRAKSKVSALYAKGVLDESHDGFLPTHVDGAPDDPEVPIDRSSMEPEQFYAYYENACRECGLTFDDAEPAEKPTVTAIGHEEAEKPAAKKTTKKAPAKKTTKKAPAKKAEKADEDPAPGDLDIDAALTKLEERIAAGEDRIIAAVADAAPGDIGEIVDGAVASHVTPLATGMQGRFNEVDAGIQRLHAGHVLLAEMVTGDDDAKAAVQRVIDTPLEQLVAEGLLTEDPS